MIPFIDILATVRELAEKYPDRHTASMYWDYQADQPECLVGTALYRLDVGVPRKLNATGVQALHWQDLGFTTAYGPPLKWLGLVQQYGDDDCTWGEAVCRADQFYRFGEVP